MKILFLTSFYPDLKSTTYLRQTKALHDFAKIWAKQPETEVLVFKLHHYPIDEKQLSRKNSYEKEGIGIFPIYIYDNGIFSKNLKNLKFLPLFIELKIKGKSLDEYNQESLIKTLNRYDYRPDLILSHGMLTFKNAYNLAMELKLPYILGFHRSDIENWQSSLRWKNYIERYIANAAGIVCRSPTVMKEIVPFIKDYRIPCFTAVSGIHPDWIISPEMAFEKLRKWKSGERPVRLVSVCNLQKLKNIDVNLNALAHLKSSISFTYDIIGSGEEQLYLEELTEKLGLENEVRFHGRLAHEEVMKRLKHTDIFIMVSAPETLGLAYLEAMARGNIIFGAKGYGIDGIVRSPDEVLLVTPKDEMELYSLLLNVIMDWKLERLKKLLENAFQKIRDLHEDKVAINYLEFIEDIASSIKNH